MIKQKKSKHLFLMMCALLSSLIYIGWRIFFTLPLHDGIVSLTAGLALVIAETISVLEAIEQYVNISAGAEPEMPEIPDEWYPDVDVLIATHNEDTSLLYKTVNGCIHMRYPDKRKVHIYLCDDKNRPEMASLAEHMGIGYFGLNDNRLAKAGNLNNALTQTSSPLVATFDADMIPISSFLMEMVPYFFLPRMEKWRDGKWKERQKPEDYEIGFIQTSQSFYNPDLFQYNLYSEKNIPNEQDYFFREINVGRNRTNAPIYAGSNTLISRKALEEVGYIKTGTITEDFATGIAIQEKGYRCYALDKALANGLAPVDVANLIKQRERWGRGCVQTVRTTGFLFGKLRLGAKLSYISCFLYWWTFLRRFIYILSPILYTVFGVLIVKCSLWELAAFWLPYYLLYNRALYVISGEIRNQRWSNIVDTIIFPYMIVPIFLETIGIREKKFIVTSKSREFAWDSGLKYAVPHLILAGVTLVGFSFCFWNMAIHHSYASIILVFWLAVNLYSLVMAIFFMRGRVNFRREERLEVAADVVLATVDGTRFISGKTVDISESGMALILDFPEYIPYDEEIHIQIDDGRCRADLEGRVTHVAQLEGQWKYSIHITQAMEMNRREYLQIIYDRHHTLPISISSNAVSDLMGNVRGRKKSFTASNRRLPRIAVGRPVQTANGGVVTLKDFNYEYVSLIGGWALPEEITLLPGADIQMRCKRASGGSQSLYRVENWKDMAGANSLKRTIAGWMRIEPDERDEKLAVEDDLSPTA